MKRISTLLLTSAFLLAAPGCDKKEEPAAATGEAAATGATAAPTGEAAATGATAAPTGEAAATGATAEAGGNSLEVLAKHSEPKPDDPVSVKFSGVKVVSANFDPANLEGATAEIEIDLTSLSSGSEKRDGHLQTPDYLDTAQFATAKVSISEVAKSESGYTAKAKVAAHGKEAEWTLPFEVVESTDDSVRVKGTHTFSRTDFEVGKAEGDPAATELTANFDLTLKKS